LENFQIQTENGNGVYTFYGFPPAYGGSVTMTEDSTAGWKTDGISCVSDDSQISVTSVTNVITFPVSLWSPVTCTFTNTKQSEKTPVLIVPGILGTEINKGSERLWLDLGRNFADIGDEFMDPLRFNMDLSTIDVDLQTGGVITKKLLLIGNQEVPIFDYSDGLLQEFQSQGYGEGTSATSTLFTFPYDWRYGVSGFFNDGKTNVDALKQKIADIRAQTGSDKVDVSSLTAQADFWSRNTRWIIPLTITLAKRCLWACRI
jgi:hypothetical protein